MSHLITGSEPKACEGGETITKVICATDFEQCQHCGVAVRHDLTDHPTLGFRQCQKSLGRCRVCGKPSAVLVRDVCLQCEPNPFRVCRECGAGKVQSEPRPDWMNRFVCDACGAESGR